MGLALAQFDDFAPDALEVRKALVDGEFATRKGPDGFEYTGISDYAAPHWPELIGKHLGVAVDPKLSCFRLNLAGEKPHSWIHSDDICATFASVLYLNPPGQCRGGTAFWRHVGLGINRMPSVEGIQAMGFAVPWFLSMMKREWMDLTYWEQDSFCAMKWNRLIVYPTSMFHSRYPFEPFGASKEDGRLIWVCFFDLANPTA